MANTRRPLIGLTASFNETDRQTWIRTNYMTSLLDAGALPVLLPVTDDVLALRRLAERLDGLVLTGGPDVDPVLYGAEDPDGLAVLCPPRDAAELALCRVALERDMPLLAICRGVQVFNVALGGTLWLDLPSQRPSETAHRQDRPFDVPSHRVTVLPDTPLRAITGSEVIAVNSMHHQAIRDPGEGLRVMALAEDGLTEAVWHPGRRFALGVQWHPEWLAARDPVSRALFAAFAEACRG